MIEPRPSSWLLTSPASFQINWLLAVGAGLAALGALLVDVLALLTGAPVHGVALLLVPAVPLLVVGQLWMISVLLARGESRRSMSTLFPGLPPKVRPLLAAGLGTAWVMAMLAFPSLSKGSPAIPAPECRWPLQNHGVVTCVSEDIYLRAGAAKQRFMASILMGFFLAHSALALSEVLRRSESDRADV
jgi:hypothetical protein